MMLWFWNQSCRAGASNRAHGAPILEMFCKKVLDGIQEQPCIRVQLACSMIIARL
jgi:hypothetical protein